jgi:N4-gp56 family major capsid protein
MFKNFLNFAFAALGLGADVVTVSTGTAGNAGNVAADLQTYFAAKLLEVAELNTILDQFGEKVPVPSNSSKTIQFVREEKFTTSTTPTQLTEGLPPDAVGLTLNQFDAVMEQYGFLTRISDLAELTAKHPVVQRTMHLLALQASETYDLFCWS